VRRRADASLTNRRVDGTHSATPRRLLFSPPASQTAASSRHEPGTPFRSCSPRSLNSMPEPATRSLTVAETSTSPGRASEQIRAPTCTAIPPTLSPSTLHSPVWIPQRTSSPRSRLPPRSPDHSESLAPARQIWRGSRRRHCQSPSRGTCLSAGASAPGTVGPNPPTLDHPLEPRARSNGQGRQTRPSSARALLWRRNEPPPQSVAFPQGQCLPISTAPGSTATIRKPRR